MSYEDFDVDKARELREKAKDGLVRESRKNLIGTLAASLPVIVLTCFALANWAQPADPESRTFYALAFLLGLLMNAGLWAVYALHARLLFLLKETKQLRLDFLSSQATPLERATGGAESLSTWASEALKPKALFIVVTALSLLATGGGLLAYEMAHKYSEAFGGQEVVEVHVTPDGMFRVVSRVSITKCAVNIASIPLRIPQPGATLESVTIGGRNIPFTPVPDKADLYTILPGMPEDALTNAILEVVWSPETADIKIQGDSRQFRLQLQGIIPFTAYTANAVIDEGAPFQFAYPGKSSLKSLNLFWSKRPNYDYYENGLGTCDVVIQAIPNTP